MAHSSQMEGPVDRYLPNQDVFFNPGGNEDDGFDLFEDFGHQLLGQEEARELDISRDPNFYNTQDSVRISKRLSSRLYYHTGE